MLKYLCQTRDLFPFNKQTKGKFIEKDAIASWILLFVVGYGPWLDAVNEA